MTVIDDILQPKNSYEIKDDMFNKMKEQDALNSQAAETQQPAYEPHKFYDQYLKDNKGYKPMTAEEKLDQEKRQKRNMLFASIGDAFSAFGNAYARARGTQPYVSPGQSLTGKLRDRYDRLNKERELRDKDYKAGMMRAMQMDEKNALSWQQLKDRNKEREAARARLEQERLDRLAQKDAELQEKIRHNKAMETRPTGRGVTTTRKNQGWTTTVRDKNGNIKSTTTRTYGGGAGSSSSTKNKDKEGKIIINY